MNSYLDWHVGMKVVFVGWPYDTQGAGTNLIPGSMHTIEEIDLITKGTPFDSFDGDGNMPEDTIYIRIHGDEYWAIASAFRPVQTRQTDISVFTALLTGTKQKAPA